ncbi:VOC family protein [Nesterenkonia muleiensis]|uniref:VOC family protein n=1 Tax=Nesterenkonia muleiensis TaxID=2282648 RepID=UPI000E74E3A3|nr:VOC family protein [Nesterenkonia muleiensis]
MIDLRGLYSRYLRSSAALLEQLGVHKDVLHNDTVCLQVPSNDRYTQVKEELAAWGELICESEVNGRLIAVFELRRSLETDGWAPSFVELPQPKTGTEGEGIRHLQFVVRTGIQSFRRRHRHLDFDNRGNARNRLLEFTGASVVVRFHDKNMGAVIELEQRDAESHAPRSQHPRHPRPHR